MRRTLIFVFLLIVLPPANAARSADSRVAVFPLPSFETAYLLQPTNRQYASAFLALLLERNQHETTLDEKLRGVAVPLEKKLVYIIRERHHRMGTTLTSQEKERYLACRKQAESYYKWYKGH